MRIVFFGSGKFGVPSLQALAREGSPDELVHIFTQPARPAGRRRQLKPTDVALWARDQSIECTEAANINSPDMVEKVAACKGDLLVVIAFGQKIGNEVINLHPKGAINVHGSLLPKYRGAAPINWAVINNEEISGITIITLAERMDAGEMLGQAQVALTEDDTAETLHDTLAHLSPQVLIETIGQIASGTAVYTAQDESLATRAPKLKKQDGFIDWSQPAESICHRIRGLWPWPGAQADFVAARTGKCSRVTIANAKVLPCPDKQKGTFGLLDENLDVICGCDRLRILKLKPAGSGLMDFRDFVNGRAIAPRDLFMGIDKAG